MVIGKTLLIGTAATIISIGTLAAGWAVTDSKKPKFDLLDSYEKIEKSKQGLLKYKEEAKSKISKVKSEASPQEDILVTITFSKPLNEAQVAKLSNDYQLQVSQAIGRAVEEDGQRASFGIVPTSTNLVDKEMLKAIFSDKKAEIKGFIELVANVPSSNLQSLANEPNVFLVDPSADESLTLNPDKDTMPGVYWNLEDFNMVAQ